MVKSVVLHIGTMKTGSSSLQSALKGYDDGQTFFAPFETPCHGGIFVGIFSPDPSSGGSWKRDRVPNTQVVPFKRVQKQKLDQMLSRTSRDRIIFSGEEISHQNPDVQEAILEYFLDRGFEVQIVLYVREPGSYAASVFQETVKHGNGKIPDRIGHDYKSLLEIYRQKLPAENIKVREFSVDRLKGGTIVADFSNLINIQLGSAKAENLNQSLSLDAVRLLYLFNRNCLVRKGDVHINSAVNKLTALVRSAYPGGVRLDPSLFVPYADYSSNTYLRDCYGIDFPDPVKPDAHQPSLPDILDDFSQFDIGPLDQLLEQHGVSSYKSPTVGEKIVRLFLALVASRVGPKRSLRKRIKRAIGL